VQAIKSAKEGQNTMNRVAYLTAGVFLGSLITIIAFTLSTEVVSSQDRDDPAKLSPRYYKVLLDNEQVRVLEYRLKPGEKEVTHSHPAGVVYGFNESKVRSTLLNGKTTESAGKAGDVFWRDAIMHSLENIGSNEVHSLAVELKNPCKK
jgi:quercetin dioxygenase-like cupin family protein